MYSTHKNHKIQFNLGYKYAKSIDDKLSKILKKKIIIKPKISGLYNFKNYYFI